MRYLLVLILLFVTPPAAADEARLNELFDALAEADETSWQQIEAKIWREWSRSGSPALDLLLDRGRDAMEADKPGEAIEHLTALVENAPEFAEGWNARATAYYSADLVGPALADIAKVIALEPRHFGALSGLGLILEESGHEQGALRAYRAALAIHPQKPNLVRAVERLEFALEGTAI